MNIGANIKLKTLTAGFTLVELLIVIGMIAIISAIATPPLIQWRQNLQYKQAADGIVDALRTAKSNTLTLNIQNRVECDPGGQKYRITQGDRSYNSATWATVKQDWTTLPAGMTMTTGTGNGCTGNAELDIAFSPNGTASANGTLSNGNICINDNTSTRYQVIVSRSGMFENSK
jgi:prepilin-type N-terminal cleavage/methylation domain-containing protein